MNPRAVAVLIGAGAMTLGWLIDSVLRANGRLAAAVMLAALVLAMFPRRLMAVLLAVRHGLRHWMWADVQGRHHAFGGIALHIEDDGRHCWIAGDDVQRVLRTRDRDDVLAARHAGCWRRDEQRRLMLRVDAVVAALAARAGRTDPAVQHFRRYLERDVLYPAARRRAAR